MKLHRRNVPVAVRCDQEWSELEGEGVQRGCQQCARQVTNLSLLPESEARAFLQDLPAGECIAYQHTPDGSLRFADTRRLPLLLAGALLVGGCGDLEDSPRPSPAVQESVPAFIEEGEPTDRPSVAASPLVLHEVHEAEDAVLDCETVRQLASLGYYVGRAECDEEE